MEPGFLDDDFGTELDLTPLIDVVFMLLLFFILASTFSSPVLPVALPEAGTAERVPEDPARLVLAIDAEGQLHHRGDVVGPESLPGLLAAHPEGPVELRVDRAAPFDAFIGALDPLREAGRSNVLITAKRE